MSVAQPGPIPPVPEPFWIRSWCTFWRWRPGCYSCRERFDNLGEWQHHYLTEHGR